MENILHDTMEEQNLIQQNHQVRNQSQSSHQHHLQQHQKDQCYDLHQLTNQLIIII